MLPVEGRVGEPNMVRFTFVLLLCLLPPWSALAEKRVALIIGNSAYQYAPRLANPQNDAMDMAAALKKLGFQVLDGFDLDKPAFDRKVRDFAMALQGAHVGVFFFAGHGLQVSGHNYLVPTDAQLSTVSGLDFEMVRLDLVHRTMEREAQTNILFLDACRDNPLARNLARAMGTRSTEIGRGLAAVESGVGTLISFSTQPGNVALDGAGRNSPFAGSLVKHVSFSSDDLSAILIAVRNDVMEETQRKQVPWEHSALTGRFYFGGPAQAATAPSAQLLSSEAAEAWGVADRTNSIAAFEAFIRRFSDTYYGDLAKVRLAELKQAEATKQAAETVERKAEDEARANVEAKRQRLALLQQQEEEQKRAEMAKQAAAAETKKADEAARAKSEADAAKKKADDEARAKAEIERQRLALLKQQEERKRTEAELRRKEEESALEDARRSDEKRKENERLRLAAIPSDEERIAFVRHIQQVLKRSHCYDGTLNGRSDDTQDSLNRFVENAKKSGGPKLVRIELAKVNVGDFEAWLKNADAIKGVLCAPEAKFDEKVSRPRGVEPPKDASQCTQRFTNGTTCSGSLGNCPSAGGTPARCRATYEECMRTGRWVYRSDHGVCFDHGSRQKS
jgi:uncharacterized caspase-like protein